MDPVFDIPTSVPSTPPYSRMSLPLTRFGSNHSKRMSLPAFITNRIDEGDETIDDDEEQFLLHTKNFETDAILARIDADKEQHDREMEGHIDEQSEEKPAEPEHSTPAGEPVAAPSLKRRASLVLPSKENVGGEKKRATTKTVNQSIIRRGSLPGTTPLGNSQRMNLPNKNIPQKDGVKKNTKEGILNKRKSLSRPSLSTLSKSTVPNKRSRIISPVPSPRANDVCADDVVIDDDSTEMAPPMPKLPTRFVTPQKNTSNNNTVTPSPIRTKRDLQTARDQLQAYETIIAKKEDRMRSVSSSLEERLEKLTRELEDEKARTASLTIQRTTATERECTLNTIIQTHLNTITQQQATIQQQQITINQLQTTLQTTSISPVRTMVSQIEMPSPAPTFNIIPEPQQTPVSAPAPVHAPTPSPTPISTPPSSQDDEFVTDAFSASHIHADPDDMIAQSAFDARVARRLSIGVPSHVVTKGRRLSSVPIHTAAPTQVSRRASMLPTTQSSTTETRRFSIGGRVDHSSIVVMKYPGITRDRVRTFVIQSGLVNANIVRIALEYDLLSGNVNMVYIQLTTEEQAATLLQHLQTTQKQSQPKYAMIIPKSAK